MLPALEKALKGTKITKTHIVAWLGLKEGGLKARVTRWNSLIYVWRSYRSMGLKRIRRALNAYTPRTDVNLQDTWYDIDDIDANEPLPLPSTLRLAGKWEDGPMKAVMDKWFLVLCNMMDRDRDFVMWGAETNSVFDDIMIRASFNYFYVISHALHKSEKGKQLELDV